MDFAVYSQGSAFSSFCLSVTIAYFLFKTYSLFLQPLEIAVGIA